MAGLCQWYEAAPPSHARSGRAVWSEGGCASSYLDAAGVTAPCGLDSVSSTWAGTRRAPCRLCGPLTRVRSRPALVVVSAARLTLRGFLVRLLRLGVRPDAVEELADLGGQAGRAYPQLGEGAGPDQPGVSKLARESLRVAE